MAYFIDNVLGWRFPPGKAADTGTIAHAILEILAQIKLAQQNNLDYAETKIGKVDVDHYDINHLKDLTYNFFKNKEPLSRHQWTDKDYKDICKYVDVVLTHNNGQFNPLKKTIIGTEQYLKVELNEPWAILADGSRFRITGFIDLVTEIDKDTIEITDYKTGQLTDFHSGAAIDYNYLQNTDIQLRLYHLAMAEQYGCDKNYLLTMFFLKYAKPMTISFTCDDLDETKKKIKDKFIQIYNTKIPKLNRTWKCTKFCAYGKNTFQGTKIAPLEQFMDGGIAKVGQICSICDQINLEIHRRGINWVEKSMRNGI